MKKVVLCDINPEMIKSWKKVFGDNEMFEIKEHTFNIFETCTDAIVSPANSLGIMRGGFDGVLNRHYGNTLEKCAQNRIDESYIDNKIPIGESILLSPKNGNFKIVIVAPTMEQPGTDISNTNNVYKAMLTILESLKIWDDINTVTCMGLGTGVGGMSTDECATQMFKAWGDIVWN